MKKIIILSFITLLYVSSNSFAQLKIGYVDSEAVMQKLPDAQDAQKRIDTQINEWQKELDEMKKEWKEKFDDYERRKLIMGSQKRADTEKELVTLEDKIEDFRQSKFGVNGELYKKQEEFMKPIQNQVFTAIEEVAVEKELDFVFDRSGDLIFLYAKEEYDITPNVLDKLQ
ncbi:MAG: OmpH family outer membrane protein [Ignavibacteriae bacterium]|nr:OmpH family outer membrane protein [Ignavibacteriota bacterium]MCB9210086.1 OmpH family outer membrane protein [Ignavibacteriales bacterium]MCB9218529.1 OmpH family outer membrane protein [Ignavibacteriales bacterium]MCB9259465.1 OmpH family outer membrane protein [Ignavibacteriales bacterium]